MAFPWANYRQPLQEEGTEDPKFPWANNRQPLQEEGTEDPKFPWANPQYRTHEARTVGPKDPWCRAPPPPSCETSGDDDPFNNPQGSQDPPHRPITGPPPFYGPGCEYEHDPPVTELKGVVIHCDEALERKESGRFAPTEIWSLEHQLHVEDTRFDIPTMIGLPIWMRHLHDDPNINGANPTATCLHLIGDIDSDEFGFPSKTWRGSTVVTRTDGVALLPQHLEAMISFCKHVFREVLGPGKGAGLSKDTAVRRGQLKTFQQLASKRGFLVFWKDYAFEKATMDSAWRDLPSPYTSYKDEIIDGEHYKNGSNPPSEKISKLGQRTEPPSDKRTRPTRGTEVQSSQGAERRQLRGEAGELHALP